MIYVVGSGPAGVACAHGLVGRGQRVTMLDAGVEMERDVQEVLAGLSARPPEEWSAAALDRIRQPTEVGDRPVPLKAAYGSLFPYRDSEKHLPIETHGVDATPSFATAGLSNVWGAAVLPYHARDIADWPIGVKDLAPHYSAAARLLNVSGVKDRLETEFPMFSDGRSSLKPSRQAAAVMRDLEASAAVLDAAGWRFGYARLAVEAGVNSAGRSCVYCGLCLYGCPYGLIYNAKSTLDQLRHRDHFSYRPDVVVTRIVESSAGVRIHGRGRTTGEALVFDGERVCLAAGTFATTAILLSSLDAYDTPVRMKDSQYFLLPVLRYHGETRVRDEPLHTLSQIFVELMDPVHSPLTRHLQVYTYNDWYLGAIKRRIGPLFRMLKPGLDALLGRLLVVGGYLHSDLSSQVSGSLRRTGATSTLVLRGEVNAATRPAVNGVVEELTRHRRHLRGIPLSPLLEVCGPGRGYHSGGSFPMRSSPTGFESDCWGRPSGFARVHAVDATVFPSIPAGPITFTIVANAHRIGSALGDG